MGKKIKTNTFESVTSTELEKLEHFIHYSTTSRAAAMVHGLFIEGESKL